MPLPTDPNEPWPPKPWAPVYQDIAEASVWYSGDKRALADFYGPGIPQRPSERVAGFVKTVGSMFWSRDGNADDPARQRVHLPAAADVAATAADLLFGDAPKITIPEAHEENAEAAAKETEARLIELAEADDWVSTLLDGAEMCSALGDIYLRPVWDQDVADHPMLTVVHGDHAVPEFGVGGRLRALTVWREIATSGKNEVIRHLERHEPGVILHGVYVGTRDKLGRLVDLGTFPETADLADTIELPEPLANDLVVRHCKNALNRRHRGLPVGRADTAGTEDLMDALDRTWSSWMRDIDLGQGRVIVADEFLKNRGGRGGGRHFDVDQAIYSPLNMDPANMEKAGITTVQFEIRTDDHARTSLELYQAILRLAGYSPQSFGMKAEGAEQTATEVNARQDRSYRTTARKQGYCRRQVEDVLHNMLILDAALFGSGIEPLRPTLEFADPDAADPRELGPVLTALRAARAASTETLVRMVQPEWEQEQIDAEVKAILAEDDFGEVPDPMGDQP